MSGLRIRMRSLSLELPGRLGKVAARLAAIGNRSLAELSPPAWMASPSAPGDMPSIFPDPSIVPPDLGRRTAGVFASSVALSPWVPMPHLGTDISVNGGIGVFDLTHAVAAVPEWGAVITLFSAALFIAALLRRGGGEFVMAGLRELGRQMNAAVDGPMIAMMSGADSGGATPRRFRPSILGRTKGLAHPGNSDYSGRFRDPQSPMLAATPPPPPDPVGAGPATPVVRTPIVLSMMPPGRDNLPEVEEAFRALLMQCPIDDQGFVDTSPLRIGHDLTATIRFVDGAEWNTGQLLRLHENAWKTAQRDSGKKQPPLDGSFESEARLMDVFRRVTGRKDLLPVRNRAAAKTILSLDVARVQLKNDGTQLREVLRMVWTSLAGRGEQLIPRNERTITVQAKNGEREQLHTLMVIYWESLKKEFGARGMALPDFDKRISDDALDIMHYQLLGWARPQPRAVGDAVIVPLSFEANDPLPDATTLQGALSMLHKFSQTPMMEGLDRFPLSPKGRSILLMDPRTGFMLNYATLLDAVHYLLAKAASDPLMGSVLRGIPIDGVAVQNPDVARYRTPGEATRTALLTFVQRHQGLPEVATTTVVRRRGGDSQPVVQVGPPPVPSRPAARQRTPSYAAAPDISHDVARARFISRMTLAESLNDALAICNSMAANGLPDAQRASAWLESVTRGTNGSLENALSELPLAEQLKPVVLPMVLNDVALRALGLTHSSSRVRMRFEKLMGSTEVVSSGPLGRYDHIVRFVVEEEARLDARPRRSISSQWKVAQSDGSGDSMADTQPDMRQRIPPWHSLEVPAFFAKAMQPMVSSPDLRLQATDVSRAFMAFMPLDEMPLVRLGRGRKDTNELVYNHLTGRSGSLFDPPPMTDADLALRAQLIAVGDSRQMLQYNEYWLGRGIKIARRDGIIPPTLRFYLAINPARAIEVLTALNDLYDQWNPGGVKDIQFKMTSVPPELTRTDSALIFAGAANQGIWKDVVALRNAHPDYFRPVMGPLGTANFRDEKEQPIGIGVAEAPRRVTDSRNGVLGNLNTQGVRDYRTFITQGMPFTPEELLRATAYYLQKGGIDLDRPAFYSGTAQRAPGWVTFAEVFRQTDQYDAQRDAAVDGH